MEYITDILVDKILDYTKDERSSFCRETTKKQILFYLRNFKPSLFTSQPVIDAFTGKVVSGADNGYFDGRFLWYESEVFYFEKYNLALTNEFTEYVLHHTQE